MTAELLQSILRGDWSKACKRTTAPEDLAVLGVAQPPEGVGDWFHVICESKSFRPVPEGAEIPEIRPFEYHSE